ncbi:MAG: metallophosphoesterase family protein [Sedimentisphaerales bacterium]|nr:metallophosphoesterase family protein [Sedimentisphaerales bacterium]
MNMLALSDIHSDLRYIQTIGKELVTADVVLVAGDITNFGGAAGASEVIEELRIYNRHVLAVPGNCDGVEVNHFLAAEGISLHCRRIDMNGVAFGGLCHWLDCKKELQQGEPARDGYGLIESRLKGADQIVLVTHQPAYRTKMDNKHGHHAGSRETRALIERLEPVLAISGHIHEAIGTDQLGKTILLNPGPLCRGCYARITLSDDSLQVELCHVNR